MIRYDVAALGGFGDLWLFSDPDRKQARKRDYRPAIVAAYSCSECGARRGEPCVRQTLVGPMVRRLPHLGRGKPGRNDPAVGEGA